MKKLSLLMTLVMLVSLIGVASPAPVAADPIPNTIVQIPVIQVGNGWETWIQVQNVGQTNTKFALLLFDYSGEYCGPQCKGPFKVEFSGRVPVGGAWTFKLASANLIGCDLKPYTSPDGVLSGLLLSLSMEQAVILESLSCSSALSLLYCMWWASFPGVTCSATFPTGWGTLPKSPAGEQAAVSVDRIQTGTGGTPHAAAYTGIAGNMEGIHDPRTGAWMYYAPQLFDSYGQPGWSSTIWIQNSGFECTSLEIWFLKQQNCLKPIVQEVLSLCPGETIAVTPDTINFMGSAWIRASQPLGVIVDEFNANGSIFMSYRGMPAAIWIDATHTTTLGSLFNFAPLIYREYNGWNAGIVVQNLSSIYNALVKVYFLDNSGDIIDTIVEWICPRGSQTFYLPAINNLPGQYVGQARVESQNWWGPGDPAVDAPYVLSVVNLVNYNTGQGAAYNTFPKQEVLLDGYGNWVALPFLVKDKHDPYEPGLTKWTSEIAMTNLDMLPGISVWRIDFFDQNGLLYSICQTLNEKQVDYIKLANIGIIPPGWLGSAVISKQCSTPYDVGALGVVVVEKATGYASGDLTKAYEGFPINAAPKIAEAVECAECGQVQCLGTITGTVKITPSGDALAGATVTLVSAGADNALTTPDDNFTVGTATTSATGVYTFTDVPVRPDPGQRFSVQASMAGIDGTTYSSAKVNVQVECNETSKADDLILCMFKVEGTARLTTSNTAMVGNTVELWKDGGTAPIKSTTTNSEGKFKFESLACGHGPYYLKLLFTCKDGNYSVIMKTAVAWVSDTTNNVYVNLSDCSGYWQQYP
jgi:hypothetical protein